MLFDQKYKEPPHKALYVLPRMRFCNQRYFLEYLSLYGIILFFLTFPIILLIPRLQIEFDWKTNKTSQMTSQKSLEELKTDLVLGKIDNNSNSVNDRTKTYYLSDRNLTCVVKRAALIDRHGTLLAISIDGKSEFAIDPRRYRLHSEEVIQQLAQTLHSIIPSKPIAKIKKALEGTSRKVISVNLSPEQVRKIQSLEGEFVPSFFLKPTPSRIYPQGRLYGHTIGYTNDDHCPEGGLEKDLATVTAQRKDPIQLSLDTNIQSIVSSHLSRAIQKTKADSAFTIVMNIHTGEIISEVSLPVFNPNLKNFFANQNPKYWQYISRNAIDRRMEFGSLLKIQNTALALENNITLDQVFDTTTPLYTNGYLIHEPFRPKFDYSVASILLKSSNWGSARMAISVGARKQRHFLNRIKLADMSTLMQDISVSRTATMSYGYGIKFNLKRYAAATAALLNGGYLIKPTYQKINVNQCYGERVYAEDLSHILVRLLLTNVVHEHATGKSAYRTGVILGGKTGTAKLTGPDGKYLEDTHTSFVGIFPAHQPKYMILTSLIRPRDIEGKPLNSGVAVAPIVGDIAKHIAVHYNMLYSPEDTIALENQYIYRTQFDEIRLAQQ